jgi:hypothetical protein
MKHSTKNVTTKVPTLVLVKPDGGGVVGGYTNTPWASSGGYATADKAFLFALSGFGIASPCKMKLNGASGDAIERRHDFCAIFGGDRGSDDLLIRAAAGSTPTPPFAWETRTAADQPKK